MPGFFVLKLLTVGQEVDILSKLILIDMKRYQFPATLDKYHGSLMQSVIYINMAGKLKFLDLLG